MSKIYSLDSGIYITTWNMRCKETANYLLHRIYSIKKVQKGSSRHGAVETNPTRNQEDRMQVRSLASLTGVGWQLQLWLDP